MTDVSKVRENADSLQMSNPTTDIADCIRLDAANIETRLGLALKV